MRETAVYDALTIIDKQPTLSQVDNFIKPLKLSARSNQNHWTYIAVQTRNDISVNANNNE